MGTYQLILASNSPRRRQLLALGGWQFRLHSAQVDEAVHPQEAPQPYVIRMAASKARAGAFIGQEPGELVIGSDTIVVDPDPSSQGNAPGGAILGKPVDALDAARMLNRLRGRTHQVITAVAVFDPRDGRLITDLCVTNVKMRSYTQDEIQTYVATGDPMDKAGAYAIQHSEFDPVEAIQGCYANVVGLPLCLLNRALSSFGLEPPLEIPDDCSYERCPFCLELMRGGI